MSDHELFSISEVARKFGVTVATLRYYEEQGLVSSSQRIGRVRHYTRDDLLRLTYALMWHRDAGMSLEDTKNIIDAKATPVRHELIAQHLAKVKEQLEALEQVQGTLEHLLDCPADDPRSCPRTGAELRDRVSRSLTSVH